MGNTAKNTLFEYGFIVLGVTIMAVAINIFLDPNNLVIGGVTGLAIIIRDLSERFIGYSIPLWLTNIILNIPLFLIGMKTLGIKFLKRTVFATMFLSLALIYTKWIPIFESDLTIASIFGGLLSGAGLGLIFRSSATTGGSDLAASIIHKYNRHISVARIMLIIDVIIIIAGFFVFGSLATMYAIIAVFIISKVVDAMLEGLSFAKAAFIISDKSDEIADSIIKNLDRGATSLFGKGMYTGIQRNVILCVVSKKEILKLKVITAKIDLNAFVIVADVREVLGEGFQAID